MTKRSDYNRTITACFTGYIVQAIINNFAPLLFLTFQREFGIPLAKITLLITVNFGVQLTVDLLSAVVIDKIGYRVPIVAAHITSAAGLILLTILPSLIDPFTGILIAVIVYAVGGGLLEVLVSPITESCPTDNKEKAMSLLHSFYCWGQVGVVLLSTLFFSVFGTERWRILSVIWAVLPAVNAFVFARVPIAPLLAEDEKAMPMRELLTNRLFILLVIMMICSGASELAVSQWASFFAESGLGISKTAGDLAGPMAFAVLMGCSRAFYGKYGDKIDLSRFMTASAALCVVSYLLTALVPSPVINLAGCAVCGLSVGIMWPGTFSKAASGLRRGGTAMFSLLALAGDIGCGGGPAIVGFVADMTGSMKTGILAAAVLPMIMVFCSAKKIPSAADNET